MQHYDTFNFDNTSVCEVNTIMEKEGEGMIKSAEEACLNKFFNRNNVLINVEEETERYILRDLHFTDHNEHFRLQNNLLNSIPNLTDGIS